MSILYHVWVLPNKKLFFKDKQGERSQESQRKISGWQCHMVKRGHMA